MICGPECDVTGAGSTAGADTLAGSVDAGVVFAAEPAVVSEEAEALPEAFVDEPVSDKAAICWPPLADSGTADVPPGPPPPQAARINVRAIREG